MPTGMPRKMTFCAKRRPSPNSPRGSQTARGSSSTTAGKSTVQITTTAARGARATRAFRTCRASPKSCANPAYSRASGYVYYGITAKIFPPLGARSVTPNTSTPPCPKCSTTSRRTSAPSQAGVTSSSSTISLPTTYSAVGALKWATSSRTAVGALRTRPARRPKF